MRNLERIGWYSAVSGAIVLSAWSRSAPGSTPMKASPSIARVDLNTLAQARFEAEEAANPLLSRIKDTADRVMRIEQEGRALVQQMDAMDRSTQQFADAQARIQVLQQDYQDAKQSAATEMDRLACQMRVDGYRALVSSTRAVAAREGFNFVIASRPVEAEFTSASVDAVLADMLARPMLVGPEGSDLTERVKAEPPSAPSAPK